MVISVFWLRYCSHLVTDEINACVEQLLTDLRFFQDRQYAKDPTKVSSFDLVTLLICRIIYTEQGKEKVCVWVKGGLETPQIEEVKMCDCTSKLG